MAKVRVFKDRRPTSTARACHRPESNSVEQSEQAENEDVTPRSEEEGVIRTAQQRQPSQANRYTPYPMRALAQPNPYFITVPGVEDIMARVHARAQQLGIRSSVVPVSVAGHQHVNQPHQTAMIRSRPPVCYPNIAGHRNMYGQHPQHHVAQGPTEVQLRGYAGLEDLFFLEQIMKHPRINSIHSFYFRFNDPGNPAGVLLIDPLNPVHGERDRYCPFVNKDAIAWLYVRRAGDSVWTRDYMAPRGSGRYAVYLQKCKPGWMWEQQLGDLLDVRKSLNLWVTVKISDRQHMGSSSGRTIL